MPGTHRYAGRTYKLGDRVYNYYDCWYGTIVAMPSEWDMNSLPPEDWWYTVTDGAFKQTSLNPERMIPADAPEAG